MFNSLFAMFKKKYMNTPVTQPRQDLPGTSFILFLHIPDIYSVYFAGILINDCFINHWVTLRVITKQNKFLQGKSLEYAHDTQEFGFVFCFAGFK